MKERKSSLSIYIKLIFVVFLISFIGIVSSYYFQKKAIEHYAIFHIPSYEKRFNEHVEEEAHKITSYIEFIKEKKEFQEYFIQNKQDKLYESAKLVFDHLNTNSDITHFYFLKPDGEVSLRVHDRYRNSDIVKRFTFLKSKETKAPYYGLEFGLKKNYTLRIVHPWIVDGKVIGYIELGKEVDKVIDSLSEQLGIEIYFAVKKSIFESAPEFVMQRMKNTFQTDTQYIVYKTHEIPQNVDWLINGDEEFNWVTLNDEIFTSHKKTLNDVSGDKLGEVLFLVNVTKEYDKFISTLWRYSAIMIFATIVMLTVGVYVARRYENEIDLTLNSLEKAKSEAEQASSAKSDFLANMSHEIRTPMTGLLGFIQRLEKMETNPEKIDQFKTVRKSGETLLNIINDILDFSKIESGKLEIESSKMKLLENLNNVLNSFQDLASSKNITLTGVINENVPEFIMGDETRLKQIVFNLMSNALKFTNNGGNITLQAFLDEDNKSLNIAVIDTGIGIAKENLQKIFESFSQEDVSTTRKYGGTGLGLAISSHLVSLMGGQLKVESKVGKGSKFYFAIPIEICKIDEVEKAVEDDQEPESISLKGEVLVVEDNKTNQMLMGMILDDFGVSYDVADNGAEALFKMKQKSYNIILMDENMPVMNGIEATKLIRENEEDSDEHIPIIAVTANALIEDRERFMAAGMDDYISKPYTEEDILEILKKYLS